LDLLIAERDRLDAEHHRVQTAINTLRPQVSIDLAPLDVMDLSAPIAAEAPQTRRKYTKRIAINHRRVLSPETKAKMAKAQQKRWAAARSATA
jgi:hypothetical protein